MNKTTRSGKTVAAGVTVTALVGVAVLATILMRGGGTGDGAGSGTGPADGTGTGSGTATPAAFTSTQPSADTPPATPQRPMKIVVRGSSYLVDGREVELAKIGELAAQVPAGSGPAVLIEHDPSSRAKAEEDLKAALNQQSIQFATD
jgi:hypothetical protein